MKISDIKTPVSSISGIGPQLTKTLAKVNIFTVGDLLQYYPRDYEDRTRKITFGERGHNPMRIVRNGLLDGGDPFFVLADFRSYCDMQKKIESIYQQPRLWTQKALFC